MDTYVALYEPGETSSKSKQVTRKIWFQEHVGIIVPVITFIAGFILGAIILFGIEEASFVSQRSDYDNRIVELEAVLAQKDRAATSSTADFEKQIGSKDAIIAILAEQMDIMNRIINFTSRLARNSVITPNSEQEADYFRRNVIYLNRQFEIQQEKLNETEYSETQSFNLVTIPQLLAEQ
jgi:hypothetical protein